MIVNYEQNPAITTKTSSKCGNKTSFFNAATTGRNGSALKGRAGKKTREISNHKSNHKLEQKYLKKVYFKRPQKSFFNENPHIIYIVQRSYILLEKFDLPPIGC